MSRKLHLATTSRDTERGLSTTPGTGTPRTDVTAPKRNTKGATSRNKDVGEIEKDVEKESKKASGTTSGKKGK